jgi:hypothetical protein
MANKIYWSKTALIGGTADALDSIDGASLTDGDFAHVVAGGKLYIYKLDDDSGATESSPGVITPDANAGTKRWILIGERTTEVTDYCDTADLEELHAAAPSGLVKKRGADITVTVGSGGDYSTINDALAALSAYYPLYVSGGFTAEISLLTGFEMAEQVLVSGIDLSWITITSVDAEVVIDRSALTTAFVSARYPAFGVSRGRLPVIGALFSMDTSGTATDRDGVLLADGSVAVISTGCGVKNAGGTGLNCYRISRALADGADFSGGDHCIACSRGSHVTVCEAVLTGATTRGIYANEGGFIVVISANCQKGASPAATDIVVGNGSTIVAINATGGLSQTANTVAAAGIIYR